MRHHYENISYFAVFLALSIALPYLMHIAVPMGGKTFLPMHIPIQLAGFIIGPIAALLLGVIAPPFNFLISGMPPFPLFIAMMLELAAMGFFAGFFFKILKIPLIISLAIAILLSKIFLIFGWWIVFLIGAPVPVSSKGAIALSIGAIVQGIPGIVAQFIIIPATIAAIHSIRRKHLQ